LVGVLMVRLLIDVLHPADVHLFKNFIREMAAKGHQVLVTARDKDVTLDLLKSYDISFIDLGRPGRGVLSKIVKMFCYTVKLIRLVKKHRPQLLVSCSSPSLAQAGFLLGIPHIIFGDTEHAGWAYRLSVPFSRYLITPACFLKDYGKKHIRYRGCHELAYLHPRYFRPDPAVRQRLGLGRHEKFILLRFVAGEALHDRGVPGWNQTMKLWLVLELSQYARVFITSEDLLPADLQPFRLPVPPAHMHHALAQAALLVSEGATTASEGAVLGIPTIYVNPLVPGYLRELQDSGLVCCLNDPEAVVRQAAAWFRKKKLREEFRQRRDNMLKEKIDVTDFMVRVVENDLTGKCVKC
jgi:predicted glycosyltransferase